jgi:hypothetical protein
VFVTKEAQNGIPFILPGVAVFSRHTPLFHRFSAHHLPWSRRVGG